MTRNALTAPTDACYPDADRAGPVMPENIARLLCILHTLVDFGRRIAATIESHAAGNGFWLFKAAFGTAKVPVISAYLHRGLLRAAALETLLLQHAAAGRDATPPPRRTLAAPGPDANAHPCDEPFPAQAARLTAERAQHDAPADPKSLATTEAIEAEVRARPIGRTIDDIRRDFGILAIMCAYEFWDALVDAIACYQDIAAESLELTGPASDNSDQPLKDNTPQERATRGPATHTRRQKRESQITDALCIEDTTAATERLDTNQTDHPNPKQTARDGFPFPNQTPRRKAGRPAFDRYHNESALARPRHKVPVPNRRVAPAADATGPPPRAAIQRAA